MNKKIKAILYKIRKIAYNCTTHFGYKYNLKIYDNDFFMANQDEGLKMAEWFIPLLQNVFNFKSFVDVGCATGFYLKYCLEHSITDIIGIEGSPAAFEHLVVSQKYVQKHDLRKPFVFSKKRDLAISIEVAEHIDKVYSDNYVKILTDAADVVVLTAATPGQGGTAHVNEQPQEWWKERFKSRSFNYNDSLTKKLKEGILSAKKNGKYVTSWFEPNIMVFQNRILEKKDGSEKD